MQLYDAVAREDVNELSVGPFLFALPRIGEALRYNSDLGQHGMTK